MNCNCYEECDYCPRCKEVVSLVYVRGRATCAECGADLFEGENYEVAD